MSGEGPATGEVERLHPFFLLTGLGRGLKGLTGAYAVMGYLAVSGKLWLGLAMAAGLGLGGNESYPREFQPFGGFADRNEVRDGFIAPSEMPGIGIEGKAALHSLYRELEAA